MVGKPILEAAEQNTIRDAVKNAEQHTSGEILCAVAHRSATYTSYTLGLSLVTTFAVQALTLFFLPYTSSLSLFLLQAFVFLTAFALLDISGAILWFVPAKQKILTVKNMARIHFLHNNLHTTQNRAAMLIFISLSERCMEIMPDVGIDQKIAPLIWQDLATAATGDIKNLSLTKAICNTIDRCATAMKDHFPNSDTDENILSDNPIFTADL